MGDLLEHQEAPHIWSWTGRFAQFLPLQTTRSIHCAFNPAKGVQGIRGFWLRSASLCSLTIALDPETAACTMNVYLKEALSKCCFWFEGDGQTCAAVLQHVREQQAAWYRQPQQPEPAAPVQAEPPAGGPSRGHPAADAVGGAAAGKPDTLPQQLAEHAASGMRGPPMQPAQPQTGAAATEPQQQPLDALAQMNAVALASEIQKCMADPAFRSLVDRVEALWDELGLPNG